MPARSEARWWKRGAGSAAIPVCGIRVQMPVVTRDGPQLVQGVFVAEGKEELPGMFRGLLDWATAVWPKEFLAAVNDWCREQAEPFPADG